MFGFIQKLFTCEKKEEDHLLFWALLGPFFLIMSLSFLGIAMPDLWGVALLGLLLCWKMKTKGFWLSLVLLGILGAIQHGRGSDHLERLSREVSIALSLLITSFSWNQILQKMQLLKENRVNLLQNLSFIDEEMKRADSFHLEQQQNLQETIDLLKRENLEKKERIDSLDLFVRTLKKGLWEEKRERETLLSENLESQRKARLYSFELEEVKRDYQGLKEKNPVTELVEELNTLRQELYQKELVAKTTLQKEEKKSCEEEEKLSLLEKNLQEASSTVETLTQEIQRHQKENLLLQDEKEKLSLQVEEKKEKTLSLEKKVADLLSKIESMKNQKEGSEKEELQKMQALYRQLREQFREKDALLHQTRKELFVVSEKGISQEREALEKGQEASIEEKALIRDLLHLQEDLEAREEENSLLEKIISKLSSSLAESSVALPKKRGRKKKVEEENQELLFKNS